MSDPVSSESLSALAAAAEKAEAHAEHLIANRFVEGYFDARFVRTLARAWADARTDADEARAERINDMRHAEHMFVDMRIQRDAALGDLAVARAEMERLQVEADDMRERIVAHCEERDDALGDAATNRADFDVAEAERDAARAELADARQALDERVTLIAEVQDVVDRYMSNRPQRDPGLPPIANVRDILVAASRSSSPDTTEAAK